MPLAIGMPEPANGAGPIGEQRYEGFRGCLRNQAERADQGRERRAENDVKRIVFLPCHLRCLFSPALSPPLDRELIRIVPPGQGLG